jgi:hypothetical protein
MSDLKINSGTLWVNENKTSDKSPDYSGTFDVNNFVFEVAIWKKKTQTGKKLLSFSFKPVGKAEPKPIEQEPDNIIAMDDIPF